MRTYASFFQWHDRQRAELGVVEELIKALDQSGARSLREPQSHDPDPPDCICMNERGETVAIEVTEVVCEEAARLTAQGHQVHREWRDGELYVHIEKQLREKDEKTYHGGPYDELLVCLFTDEMYLWPDRVRQELRYSVFGPFKQLTDAYFLCSYEPVSETYPLVQLRLQHAA